MTAERYSSVQDIMDIVKKELPSDDDVLKQQAKPYDYATAAQNLEDIARKMDAAFDEKFFIEELECAGDITMLVISEFPLLEETAEEITGTSYGEELSRPDEARHYVEMRSHTWTQRSFVYEGENTHASYAVFTLLGEYKYWTVGSSILRYVGLAEPEFKICPIAFLYFSDGQAEILDDKFRATLDRPMASLSTVEGARAAYSYTSFEALLGEYESAISEVKRLEKKDADREINKEKEVKEWVARIARDMKRTGTFDGWGIKNVLVRLWSNAAVRMFVYLGCLVLLYLALALIINFLNGYPVLWEPWSAGGGGGTPDPGGVEPVTGPGGETP